VRVVHAPVAELALAAVPTAVRLSRVFAAHILRHWQLDHMIEDAELVTSELVTNAVAATGLTAEPERWSQLLNLAMIHVRFTLYKYVVVLEVQDRAAAVPVLQAPADDDEGSRGLAIVEALAAEWGYRQVPEAGKVVWAKLAIPAVAAKSEPLARRLVATELRDRERYKRLTIRNCSVGCVRGCLICRYRRIRHTSLKSLGGCGTDTD
jgi:anti-sigma regulatory factor (Ser/Thr protein kinase)